MKRGNRNMLRSLEIPRHDAGLDDYIYQSLRDAPKLLHMTLDNQTVRTLAKYLRRHKTGSACTLRCYASAIKRYSEYAQASPDDLIRNCLYHEGEPDPKSVKNHTEILDDWIGDLQNKGLASGSIFVYTHAVKSFYHTNGVTLRNQPLHGALRVRYRDRAPTPQVLRKLLDIATLREKVILSILASSGIRIGTLTRLKYRHIQEDYEKGTTPIHMHIEADITKGKFVDYDTFTNKEAAEYLKLYLEERKRGSPKRYIAPETITPDSFLIRKIDVEEPLKVANIGITIHNLYMRSGLISHNRASKRYQYRAHSLRKYFKTQMTAQGVQPDYVEYMMGHKISTYHDVEGLGIEFLRGIYKNANIATQQDTVESRKEVARNVINEILRKLDLTLRDLANETPGTEEQAAPHRLTVQPPATHVDVLRQAVQRMIQQEILQKNVILPVR
ncbi:MAG TPA: site-specific integrase [Candidatus Bathyarchaeia archaeon]|nr:site-specific integrase [Candidatus Bathyarchaeia archaeon]